jgi:hypothetical protein
MKKIILTLTALMFTFMAVNAQTVTTPPSPKQDNPNGPVITFDSLVHDFGTIVKRTDPANCEFKFKNTGKEPLILSDVKSSCGCTIPVWPKEPILPGKTGVIKVSYTKTANVGIIAKQITVFSNANNGNIVLSIKGTVVEDPNAPKTTTPTTPVAPKK